MIKNKEIEKATEVFAIIGFADKVVSLEDARDNSLTLTQDESYLVGYEDVDGNECNEDGTYVGVSLTDQVIDNYFTNNQKA